METVVLAIQRVARGKELLARFLKEGTVSKPLWRVQWVHFTLNKWSRPWGRRRGAPKSPFCIPKSSALLIQPMESISLPPPSPQKLKDAWRLNFSRFCSELSCHCTQARWAVKSPGWGLCTDPQLDSYNTWLGLLNPCHPKPTPLANCILLRWVLETGEIVMFILSIMCARHFEASFPLSYTGYQLQHMVQGSSLCSLF